MRRGLLIVACLSVSARAHGPGQGACPSPGAMEPVAERGQLDDKMRACLRDAPAADAPKARWVAWKDAAARGSGDPLVAKALLDATGEGAVLGADDALWLAEHVQEGGICRSALERAALSGATWADPATRRDREGRLRASWTRCAAEVPPPELAPPAPPTAADLAACSDLGALWSHALWGKGYASERDCLGRALLAAPPAHHEAVGRLARWVAAAHPDEAARRAIDEAAGATSPSSPP